MVIKPPLIIRSTSRRAKILIFRHKNGRTRIGRRTERTHAVLIALWRYIGYSTYGRQTISGTAPMLLH